jgi:Tfp pilus assembly protein FimT
VFSLRDKKHTDSGGFLEMRREFTPVELMSVVVIISLVAAISSPSKVV